MADVTTRTVTGKWTAWDKNSQTTKPARGEVTFYPSNYVVIANSNTVVIKRHMTIGLDSNGEISVDLPVTDDPNHSPANWHYWVEERIDGQAFRSYNLSLPEASSLFDISAMDVDAEPPEPEAEYLLSNDPRVPLHPEDGQRGQAVIVGSSDNLTFGDVTSHVGDKDNPITDPDYTRPPGAGPKIWFATTHINTAEPQDLIVRVDRAINV